MDAATEGRIHGSYQGIQTLVHAFHMHWHARSTMNLSLLCCESMTIPFFLNPSSTSTSTNQKTTTGSTWRVTKLAQSTHRIMFQIIRIRILFTLSDIMYAHVCVRDIMKDGLGTAGSFMS
jgi:hypothetical protein